MSNFKSKKYKSLFVFNNNLNYGKYPEYFGGNGIAHYTKASEINRIFGLKVK